MDLSLAHRDLGPEIPPEATCVPHGGALALREFDIQEARPILYGCVRVLLGSRVVGQVRFQLEGIVAAFLYPLQPPERNAASLQFEVVDETLLSRHPHKPPQVFSGVCADTGIRDRLALEAPLASPQDLGVCAKEEVQVDLALVVAEELAALVHAALAQERLHAEPADRAGVAHLEREGRLDALDIRVGPLGQPISPRPHLLLVWLHLRARLVVSATPSLAAAFASNHPPEMETDGVVGGRALALLLLVLLRSVAVHDACADGLRLALRGLPFHGSARLACGSVSAHGLLQLSLEAPLGRVLLARSLLLGPP
mmetsp:Transcript_82355/g.221318  ORF Transcript_82355/g.221318 Transcript_82355/m.221318 type:complete len:312 (-) Transcript_82355:366-1301(-)